MGSGEAFIRTVYVLKNVLEIEFRLSPPTPRRGRKGVPWGEMGPADVRDAPGRPLEGSGNPA